MRADFGPAWTIALLLAFKFIQAMNSTLNSNRIFNRTSHAIGADTENFAVNVPKRAFKVLNDFLHGRNRSAKVRQYVAEGIQREDVWYGLAFRAAIGMKNFAKSIFTPAPPKEMAEVWTAKVEELTVAIKNPENLGGSKVAADAISEFLPGGTFEDHRKEAK